MAPAGIGEEIAQAVFEFKPGPHRVFQNIGQFFKSDDDGVMARNGGDDAIFYRVIIAFFDKGSKHPVPDNENAAIITVQIARICAVMDTVMAGRVENKFKPSRKFLDRLRMYPELINQIHCANENHE